MGSEMCIRDSNTAPKGAQRYVAEARADIVRALAAQERDSRGSWPAS